MTLVRAIGRTMLSSYFVLSGIRAIRNPDEFVADAQPVADRLVPAIKRYAPNEVADFVPENTATLVRVNGAFQLAGGLAMATGKGRRLGAGLLALSMIPTTLARHPFWTRDDPEQKAHDRQQFVKNVGLLGGVIIASRDTEGRPGLVWRANEGRELAVKRTRKARKAGQQARKNVSHSLDNVGKSASKVQKRAIEAAEDASKNVRKAAGGVRSSLGEHIELGQN
jgi:uncharacterized membrane protein YphA (DoxX/SURF4 family)